MSIKKNILFFMFLWAARQPLIAIPLIEQLKQTGYVELCDTHYGTATFESLYAYLDELVAFLHENPLWIQKLYQAKERFIRSKERDYYATDFFGFYDESKREGRHQISFYYAIHFHEFINTHYPECKKIPAIINFFDACFKIEQAYASLCDEIAAEIGLDLSCNHMALLLKVVTYLPAYAPTRPHYDGTAFSLLLNSTNNQALLLSPYKAGYTLDDFISPRRQFPQVHNQNSIIIIPGTQLTEFSIDPTPHVVTHDDSTRYATIVFAMRPYYIHSKNNLSPLPNFKD